MKHRHSVSLTNRRRPGGSNRTDDGRNQGCIHEKGGCRDPGQREVAGHLAPGGHVLKLSFVVTQAELSCLNAEECLPVPLAGPSRDRSARQGCTTVAALPSWQAYDLK